MQLAPMWIALPVTFTCAVLIAGVALWSGLRLLDVHGVKHEKQIDSKVLFDLVKLSFAMVAGVGGLVALVVAYRKQRTEENSALREDTKLHSDRFTAAVAQLGDPSPAVQLGGVHAVAGLADDAPTPQLRQTCIDVLCAYLRLPYDPDPGDRPDEGADPAGYEAHFRARAGYRALREVRHTVIRIIGNHLRDDASVSWRDHDFDFTDVVFDGGDLHGAVFTGATLFTGAAFASGRLDLSGTRFASGTADFRAARFTGGTVDFLNVQFTDGTVSFVGAEFTGGTVYFVGAAFMGASIYFSGAEFTGGEILFIEAKFSAGEVDFNGSKFVNGTVDFSNAEFTDNSVVSFVGATGRRPHGLPDGFAPQLS
ncbi:pentapeptide repeat-containing protein [Actinomadura luteofluorescens]|uniref:pentapeptide repeat-containing protein n=1 Tax=Actinomadura luteofluorescens TaxID=46163 RepID=UPI001C535B18|nr:pentapeptide repeat-containing protein [Actinomadura luteofluorescens]